jgi:hypothetical protein
LPISFSATAFVGSQVVPVPVPVVVVVDGLVVVEAAFFFVDAELFFVDDEFLAVVVVLFVFGPFALLTSPVDVGLPFGEDVVVVLVVFVVFGADPLFVFGAASIFTDRAVAAASATGSAIHLLIRMDTCLLGATVEQAAYPVQKRNWGT